MEKYQSRNIHVIVCCVIAKTDQEEWEGRYVIAGEESFEEKTWKRIKLNVL